MTLAVATPWFDIQSLGDGVTLIREPHVLGGAFTNMWHVRGRDRDLLFDSGMGVLSLRKHVALLAERPVVCVASHTHFDHVGGHHEFGERVVHELEASILGSGDPVETVLEGYRDVAFDALPYPGFDVQTYRVTGAPATRTVVEGDLVDLGDRHFEVWHLPGHSPGSITLWERRTGLLLSGDVITQGRLLDDLYHSDVDAYLESLTRIRDLAVERVLPGHYEPFGRDEHVTLVDRYLETRRRPACPLR